MLFSRGFLFPLLSLYALRAAAVATNRTIDDTIGDSVTGSRPVYLPTTVGVWEDATCSRCLVKPDQSRAFKGTWTAATYNPGLGSMSIELSFQGTAIYIFFILAGIIPGATTETACNFTFDDQLAGTFNHTPSTASDLQYDALVYSERNLRNVDHKLIISTSADHNVFVNFDYAIYTADDTPTPSPSTPSPSPSVTNTETTTSSQTSQSNLPVKNNNLKGGTGVPIGAIVGGVVGGLVLLVALILLFLFCQRRRRRAIKIQGSEVTPHLVPFVSKGYSHSSLQLSTPYRDRHITHSDFTQSGTIAPSRSSIEVGASSTYQTSNNSPSFNGGNTPSTFLAHHRDMTNPNIVSTLPSGGIMLPANSDQAHNFRSRPPVSPPLHGSQLDTTETTRRARQQELDRQLRAVKQEMRDLTTDIQAERTSEGLRQVRSEDVELTEMREQMRLMREQIEFLRTQQQSDWAQGLSDNPPPGYSPRSSSIRVPY